MRQWKERVKQMLYINVTWLNILPPVTDELNMRLP